MKLQLSQSSPEVRAALIEAVARVYASGLQAADTRINDLRQEEARRNVDDFLAKLDELGGTR